MSTFAELRAIPSTRANTSVALQKVSKVSDLIPGSISRSPSKTGLIYLLQDHFLREVSAASTWLAFVVASGTFTVPKLPLNVSG